MVEKVRKLVIVVSFLVILLPIVDLIWVDSDKGLVVVPSYVEGVFHAKSVCVINCIV